MSSRALTRERVVPAAVRGFLRPMQWPWWVQVLAIYAATRLASAVVLLFVARYQEATPWTPASPGYRDYTGTMWDGTWYRGIAEHGYPAELPRGADGLVQQNAWAFFPLYPMLVRVLMLITGLGWSVIAPTLSLVLGGAAVLVIYRLVRSVVGPADNRAALGTVLLIGVFPSAVILQVAYTESLALLLIAAVLLLVRTHRYRWASVVVLALGFTRATALPMAIVVLLHALQRWREHRRGTERLWPAEAWSLALLGLVTVLAGFAWPVLVGILTGERNAYLETQATWRGRQAVVPVRPWFDVAAWLFGRWGVPLLIVLVVAAAALILSRATRRLGPELQGWSGGYLAYLFLVIEPGSSLFRFMLLAFPFGTVTVRASRSRWWLPALVTVGLIGQLVWTYEFWRLTPPSGWPP